jgi:hypothetical protein
MSGTSEIISGYYNKINSHALLHQIFAKTSFSNMFYTHLKAPSQKQKDKKIPKKQNKTRS